MTLLNCIKKDMLRKSKLTKANERRIVAALSRGNISLQMGQYLTEEDIEGMRKQVNRRK